MISGSPFLIDTHCHFDCDELYQNREAILSSCWEGPWPIGGFPIPAIRQRGWSLLLERAAQIPDSFCALGVHPWFLEEHDLTEAITLLSQMSLTSSQRVVAIGEIGLDFYGREEAQEKRQELFFREQLRLAQTHQRPVILHVRKAHQQTLKILKEEAFSCGGIVHSFSGSWEEAQRYLSLNFKMGLGLPLLSERAHRLRELVRRAPLTSLLIETDSPYGKKSALQENVGTPQDLVKIFLRVQELRSTPPEGVALTMRQTVEPLFRLSFRF